MQPPVVVEDLPRLLLVPVVPLKNGGAPDAHLSAGVGQVRREVVHLGDVGELDLAAGGGSSDVARGGVLGEGEGDGAGRLGHAVALLELV